MGRQQSLPIDRNERNIAMNLTRSFSSWRKYRQTVSELDRMSNRELADLGISRPDIRRVARAAAF
jgi:uncharacterized protein YjiS (DUF1127 family)